MYVSRSSAFKMVSDRDNCSGYKSCTPCTTKSTCKWSLVYQSCTKEKQQLTSNYSNLTIRNQSHCPRYIITKKMAFVGEQYRYTVGLSNDVTGFAQYLQKRDIVCDFGDGREVEAWVINNTKIVCNIVVQPDFPNEPVVSRLLVYNHSVIVDGVLLGLDDMSDYYFHSYRGDSHYRCSGPERDDDCVSTFWYDTAGARNYLKQCQAENPCTGAYVTSIGVTAATAQIPKLKILAIDPIVAPWTGVTTMTVRVTNRWSLIERNTTAIVTVTVAGRDCVDPRAIDDGQTVACEMSPVAADELGRVRVRVTFRGRDHRQMSITVTSLQYLHKVYPEITGFSPKCGHVNGGTRLTVTGHHLNAIGNSTMVNVLIGEQQIKCRTVERTDDHITCETDQAKANATGVVEVKFGQSLVKYVTAPLFVYTHDPELYKGQFYEGLASGGTMLMVSGQHFSCIETAEVFIKDAARKTGCEVLNDTRMACRSPSFLDTTTVHKTLNLGVHVRFLGREFDLRLPSDSQQYHLYSDPEITDFEVLPSEISDSAVVVIVIHGSGLDHGYTAEDVVVRPWNSNASFVTLCNVTSIQRDRIVCQSNNITNPRGIRQLNAIVVTIGNALVYNITVSKSYQSIDNITTVRPNDFSISSLYGVIQFDRLLFFAFQFIVFIVVLCTIVVYIIFFRSKTTRENEMSTYPLPCGDLKFLRKHKTTTV